MIDVTVLFLEGTFASTATGPMDVFNHAGSLWNSLTGTAPRPRFRDTTARLAGRPVHAALDLTLYLVEKFCGHDVAMQSAKAMLIETPRAWQAGFAIVPLKTEHSDQEISNAQEWLHENFHRTFPLDALARRVGMSLR